MRLTIVIGLVVATVGLSGCGAPSSAIEPRAVAIASIAAPAASSAPKVEPPAKPPPWVHVRPKPGEPAMRCGEDELCRPEDEVCCGDGTCKKRIIAKTASSYEELGPQFEVCGGGGPPRLCGDSSHCAASEICGLTYFTSDADLVRCVAAGGLEVCQNDAACRTAGTACSGGICRRTDLKCDGKVCAKGTTCCNAGGKASCSASCAADAQLECFRTADCPGSTACQAYGGRSYCTGTVDIANAQVVCERDDECEAAGVCRFSGNGKGFCKKGKPFGVCACR